MFEIKLQHVIFMFTLQSSYTERRITGGKEVERDHKFVVYLVKSPKAPPAYDAWLCGGALVSDMHIVTSAACVEDVQHVYAIAGYKKYVPANKLDTDACTKNVKKKVVLICVPRSYTFDYNKVEKWAFIDIAVLKVESPYSLGGPAEEGCSYGPDKIPINFEPGTQSGGASAMAFGWGHVEAWRQVGDKKDYNQEMLRYASTLILPRNECLKQFTKYQQLLDTIKKYMICTTGNGNFDEDGEIIDSNIKPVLVENGCITTEMRMLGMRGVLCKDDRAGSYVHRPPDAEGAYDRTRRNFGHNATRRQGICQNDHGGPLVAWLRGKQVLIGIASVFKIDKEYKCKGPYLFTSTECNGAFLDCLVNGDGSPSSRRYSDDVCNGPPALRGYDITERRISWKDHPDGPAANEIHEAIDEDVDIL